MKISKIKIDSVKKTVSLRRRVRSRLSRLRFQVVSPKIIEQRVLLRRGKRILFALGLVLSRGWKQNVAVAVSGALSFLLLFWLFGAVYNTANFSKQILGEATVGLEFLQNQELALAGNSFEKIRHDLQSSNDILLSLFKALPAGKDLERISEVSGALSMGMAQLVLGADELGGIEAVWNEETNALNRDLYLGFLSARKHFVLARESLEQAERVARELRLEFLPEDLRYQFAAGQEKLGQANLMLGRANDLTGSLLGLLGGEEKVYLLVFQNNNEVRATGGFLGTYGLAIFGEGGVRIDKIESIYALDGQLREDIAAPGPIQRQVSPTWGLRDSNWFADFGQSARKMLEFLEKESGILADGVIAFIPDLFEELLNITGPVHMPEYGVTLTSDNFRDTTQFKTSLDYDLELNRPKKFLADFAPRLFSRLLTREKPKRVQIFEALQNAIMEKDLMMFSLDPELERQIRTFNMSGELRKTPGDFLGIFHSNVGGGKTDLSIRQVVQKQVTISKNGIALVKLRVTRKHEGFDEQFFPKNVDYMRIFVPAQSRLVDAAGFDESQFYRSTRPGAKTDDDLAFWDAQIITDPETGILVGREGGYTTFSGWLELMPGESKTVELTYELPQEFSRHYSHLLQIQPGSPDFEFDLNVETPAPPVYVYPEDTGTKTIREDAVYGVVWQ